MHHLTHFHNPPIFDTNGTSIITKSAIFWSFKAVQLVISTAALSSNVAVAYTCINAFSVGRSLRRVLLASCISHAFIAGYVLTKCARAFIAMSFDHVETLESSVNGCKVQEALYLIAYAHCALVLCTLGGERCKTLYERRRRRRMGGNVMKCAQDKIIVHDEAPRVVQVRTNDGEVTRQMSSTASSTIQTIHASHPMNISHHSTSSTSSRRGSSSCTMLMILLLMLSVGVVLTLLVHVVWEPAGENEFVMVSLFPSAVRTLHQMSPTGLLPTCSILLAMDTMLVLCLCCTVLLLYMLAIIIFLIAVVFQRMADQEKQCISRLHATTQLGKLLLTMVAVWGFDTIAVGLVMLAVLLDYVHRLDVGVIYANELFVYTMPPVAAFIHALVVVWHVSPLQQSLLAICPCATIAIPSRQRIGRHPPKQRTSKQYKSLTARKSIADKEKSDSKFLEIKSSESPSARRTSMLGTQTLVKINEEEEEVISLSSISFATSNSDEYLDINIDMPDDKAISVPDKLVDFAHHHHHHVMHDHEEIKEIDEPPAPSTPASSSCDSNSTSDSSAPTKRTSIVDLSPLDIEEEMERCEHMYENLGNLK